MRQAIWHSKCLVCGLVGVLAAVGGVSAQPPRARTLVYDPQSKDWTERTIPMPGTPEGDIYAIKNSLREKRYRRALSEVQAFKRCHGHGDPLYPQALLLEAEAQVGLKEFDNAHAACQLFLGEFSGMELTDEALRLEFVIAEAFLAGAKHKVWGGVFRVSGENLGNKILDEISADHPDSRIAELAVKAKGDHLVKTGEHALAEIEYSRMIRDYPKSRYNQFAVQRTAESALASFAGVEYDEAALIEAEERYKDYRTRYRDAAERDGVGLILDTIRETRAEKDFQIGQYYERTDHVGSAVFYYKNVRAQFEGTIAATKATERLELLGAIAPVAQGVEVSEARRTK